MRKVVISHEKPMKRCDKFVTVNLGGQGLEAKCQKDSPSDK